MVARQMWVVVGRCVEFVGNVVGVVVVSEELAVAASAAHGRYESSCLLLNSITCLVLQVT